MRKKDLVEGKYYLLVHREEGEVIGQYVEKTKYNKLRFRKISGGIDFRMFLDTRPNMARYTEIPNLDEEDNE